ncbi:MAG: YcdB/YcdC domain-containing protein [Clostridia bacterium]
MNWDGNCVKEESILQPRKEFTEKLEALLLEEARKIKRKHQVKRRISRNMQLAAGLALVIGITTSTGKLLVQHNVINNPSNHLAAPDSWQVTSHRHEAVNQPDQQISQDRTKIETVAPTQTQQSTPMKESKPAPTHLEVKQNVQEQSPLHFVDQNRNDQDGIILGMKEEVKKRYNVDLSQYRLNPLSSEKSEGHFVFERTVKGIPVWGESLTLSLSKNGSIDGVNWDTIDGKDYQESRFPEPTGVLTAEEVQQKLKNYVRLVYFEEYATKRSPFSQSVLEKKPVLTYQFQFNGSIDAFTGKTIEPSQLGTTHAVSPIPVQSGGGLFIRSEEEARNAMTTFGGIRDDGDVQIQSESNLKIIRWVEKNGRIVTVQTDHETGRVIGMEVSGSNSDRDNHASAASHSLSKKAVSVLEQMLDPEVKEVHLERTIQKEHGTEYCFVPLHQGVPVIDRTFFITLDNQTGEIIGIQGDFTRSSAALPSQQHILSIDEALATIMKNTHFELMYSWADESGNKEKTPLLVYRQGANSRSSVTIDAKTGEILP